MEYKCAMDERLEAIGKHISEMALCFPQRYIVSTDYGIEGAVVVGLEAHGIKKRFKVGAHLEKEWKDYKKEIEEYVISKYCELEKEYFRSNLNKLNEGETLEGI